MVKNNVKPYLLQGIVVMSLTVLCLMGYLLTMSLKVADEISQHEYTYVSSEILSNNVEAVIKEDTKVKIERPYKADNIEIAKTFYDYKSEEKSQEQSITYYENTYIQNKGVDYKSENPFQVFSVLDGKVISITEDEIVGTTIKIQHNNNIISTYQCIKDVVVKKNETVTQGQVLGTSSTNNYDKDMGNHLHFELYVNNKLVNPEEYFNKTIEE